MGNKQKFETFLESLKGNGQNELIESVKQGFQACFEDFGSFIEDKDNYPTITEEEIAYLNGKISDDIMEYAYVTTGDSLESLSDASETTQMIWAVNDMRRTLKDPRTTPNDPKVKSIIQKIIKWFIADIDNMKSYSSQNPPRVVD